MPQPDGPDLFDAHGRCLPGRTSAPVHRESRRYFRLGEPEARISAFLDKLSKSAPLGTREKV